METYICSVCGEFYDERTYSVPALGHDLEVTYKLFDTHVEKTSICHRCGLVEVEALNEVDYGACTPNGVQWTLKSTGELVIAATGNNGNMVDYAETEARPWSDYSDLISTIVIRSGITYVGNYAFKDLTKAGFVIFEGIAPVIAENAFAGVTANVAAPGEGWNNSNRSQYGGELNWMIARDETAAENLNSYFYGNGLLVITGSGEMKNFEAEDETPWYRYRDQVTHIHIGGGITTIGSNAFKGFNKVTLVSLPGGKGFYLDEKGIREIGSAAFQGCSSIIYLKLSEDTQSIGEYAFQGCTALKKINFPGALTFIGSYAFKDCTSLEEADLAGTAITGIGEYTFNNCTALKKVYLPNTVEEIGQYAFANCTAMNKFLVPWALTTIGDYAFYNCRSLEEFIDAPRVTSIGSHAFDGCTKLREVALSSDLTTMGTYAFQNCKALTSVNLSYQALTEIPDYAFYGCTSLKEVLLSDRIKRIGNYAFYNSGLVKVAIPASVTTFGTYIFALCTNLEEVILPENMRSIPARFLHGCKKLSRINLPEGLTTINEFAFYDCDSLVSIVLPKTVTSIGFQWTFASCESLKYVVLNEGLKSIPYYGFYDCPALERIIIPSSVTTINHSAFRNCLNLKSIVFMGSKPKFTSTSTNQAFDGVTATVTTIQDWAAADKQNYGGTLTWANKIASGPAGEVNWAFFDSGWFIVYGQGRMANGSWMNYLDQIKYIKIGDGVTNVSQNAFFFDSDETDQIIYIELSPTVKTIESGAFFGGTKPREVVLFEGLEEIGSDAFCYNTFADTILFMPSSLRTIGNNAYQETNLTKVVLNEGLTTLEGAFTSCNNLTSVVLPSTLKKLGAYAFYGCPKLTSIYLPDGLEEIGDNAFVGTGITEIVIPASVTKLGNFLFADRTSKAPVLTDIIFLGSSPTIAASAFYRVIAHAVAAAGWPSYQNYNGSLTWENVKAVGRLDEDLMWSISNNGVLTIEGSGEIPDFYDVERPWNNYEAAVTSIVLKGNITKIGYQAFSGFYNVSKIQIPETVIEIGESAFRATGLTNVVIPDSVTKLGETAFRDCQKLKSVVLGSGITEISTAAFSGCYSLNSVNIPDTVTSIGDDAFACCSSLTEIVLPDGLESIGENAFSGASSIRTIIIPASVKVIKTGAFAHCENLERIIFLGDCPETIETGIFNGVAAEVLTVSNWPDDVKKLCLGDITWTIMEEAA